MRTQGIENLSTQQSLARRELNWKEYGGGKKHETLIPKILCVSIPLLEDEIQERVLRGSQLPLAPGGWGPAFPLSLGYPCCSSEPSVRLGGWPSWSCLRTTSPSAVEGAEHCAGRQLPVSPWTRDLSVGWASSAWPGGILAGSQGAGG